MATLALEKTRTHTLEEDRSQLKSLLNKDFRFAQDYLPQVRERHGDVPELAEWIRVLSPAKVTRGESDTPGRDMIHDFNWIKANAGQYYGQWLALYEGELLAHGDDPAAVRAEARAKSPAPDFLFFHAVGMPS
jgi:hypothetical protein